jgi:hypothetical protein
LERLNDSRVKSFPGFIHSFIDFFLVYVDASESCNQLNFQLGPNGIGTAVATRSWNLKVIYNNQVINNLHFQGIK